MKKTKYISITVLVFAVIVAVLYYNKARMRANTANLKFDSYPVSITKVIKKQVSRNLELVGRPFVRWSRVSACIAVEVGVRAESWTIDVPSRMRSVWEPHHARGVRQSLPYASAVQNESNPSRSASLIASSAPEGGPDDQ